MLDFLKKYWWAILIVLVVVWWFMRGRRGTGVSTGGAGPAPDTQNIAPSPVA